LRKEGGCGAGQEAGEIAAEPGALRFFNPQASAKAARKAQADLQRVWSQSRVPPKETHRPA